MAGNAVGRILDVGCGNGVYLADHDDLAVGIDLEIDPRWVQHAADFAVADASNLPFTSKAFDTILSFETLEHLSDPLGVLEEYRRVTRRIGIFTVPNCVVTPGQRQSNLIYHHWIDPSHNNFFDVDSLKILLEAAGWTAKSVTTINQVDLGPLFSEALRLPMWSRRALSSALRRFARPYRMTILALAEPSG